jgi:hypothetical protein
MLITDSPTASAPDFGVEKAARVLNEPHPANMLAF